MLQEILNFLFSGEGNVIPEILILDFAVLCLFWIIYFDLARVLPANSSIKSMIRKLDDLEGCDPENIGKMDTIFESGKRLHFNRQWKKYRENDLDDLSQQEANSLTKYFNTDTLLTMPCKRKQAEIYMPLMGVLGGLTIILAVSALVFGSKDISEAYFAAAIVAFGLAILYWVADRLMYANAVRNLSNLCERMNEKTPKYTTGSLLRTIVKSHDEETRLLGTLDRDLIKKMDEFLNVRFIPSIQREFERALLLSITPSISRMACVMDEFLKQSLKAQGESMKIMADEFADRMNENMMVHFSDFSRNTEKLLSLQSEVSTGLNGIFDKLTEAIGVEQSMLSTASETIKASKAQNEMFAQDTSRIISGIEQLVTASNMLHDATETNKNIMSQLAGDKQEFKEVATLNMNRISEQMLQLNNDLKSRTDTIFAKFADITSATLTKYEDNTANLTDLLTGGIKNLIDNLQGQVLNLGLFAKEINDDITVLNNTLNTSVRGFNESVSGTLESAFQSFDRNMAQITGRLCTVVTEINESVSQLPGILAGLKTGIKPEAETD